MFEPKLLKMMPKRNQQEKLFFIFNVENVEDEKALKTGKAY